MNDPPKRPSPKGKGEVKASLVEQRPSWTWCLEERKERIHELDTKGDAIADWLEARGIETTRQQREST
jgi:hypothetical protein